MSKRERLSFGSGASGSGSGGGDGRIGGVDGFAGSRICVEVDINRFSIAPELTMSVKTLCTRFGEFRESRTSRTTHRIERNYSDFGTLLENDGGGMSDDEDWEAAWDSGVPFLPFKTIKGHPNWVAGG